MYNKCLEYLLDNDPQKTISKHGIAVRKIFNPLLRIVIPFTTPTKLIIVRRARLPKRPIIFAASHGFKDDVGYTLITANRQAYILLGSLPQVFNTFEGICAWAVGTILVNRIDKDSRHASKEKMIRAINLGASVIIFPEGTWNTSPNKLVGDLFPGVYDVASATGALVAPIATHREGKKVFSILDAPFDITKFSRTDGVIVLRDKLSTLKWELMEKYSPSTLEEMPVPQDAETYWERYISSLWSEVEFHDIDVENRSRYINKKIVEYSVVFAHLQYLHPSNSNVFLFNKRNHN